MTLFEQSFVGNACVLRVSGEVDMATASEFLASVQSCLGQCVHLSLDLSGVSFIDSSGLGVLLQVRSEAIDAGKSVTLVALSAVVSRLLQVTGLAALFGVVPGGGAGAAVSG